MPNYTYSNDVNRIMQYSREEALRLESQSIEPEHIMLGIIRDGDNTAATLLQKAGGVSLPQLKRVIEQKLLAQRSFSQTGSNDLTLSPKATGVLRLGILESRLLHSDMVGPEHLLLAMMKQRDNLPAMILRHNNVEYEQLFSAVSLKEPMQQDPQGLFEAEEADEGDTPPPARRGGKGRDTSTKTKKGKNGKDSDTPAIDTFGFDLTQAAQEGTLDPVVGREREIMRLAQILCRRKKNNPVLIGEPGVGKNAIVEGLAQRISERNVPRTLIGKRLITLDMAGMVAGTKYRGQFEERMKAVIEELKAHKEIIVFIDEIHTLVGAGNQAGQMDAANMMKPALSRGELQCIGATTLDEYRQSIEKDGALERRFQKIIVEQPSLEETITILNNLKPRYEDHHHVRYTPEAIEACARLTGRYVSDRAFPDKAIDAMDEAGASVHISSTRVPKELEAKEQEIVQTQAEKNAAVQWQDYERAISLRDKLSQLEQELNELQAQHRASDDDEREQVDVDKVAETVATMTGIPVQRMAESEWVRLKGMRGQLKSQVIGQDSAIDKLVSSIQRSRLGLSDPHRPIGTFLFLGPTGVGKTFLAKKLAEHMFGTADALIRIDMSEYMEKFTVSRLVGAPPGYVGYEEGGMLTERVRRKPYAIVLLDEVEKAHPDALNILLQVMDDGRLTDSLGRTIDFRNTVLIMTSNAGSKQLKDFGRGVGFNASMANKERGRGIVRKALDKLFTPEFLNRIDEIITFDALEMDSILTIVEQETAPLQTRCLALGYQLDIPEEAKRFLAEKGYDKQYGARPLRRAVQTYLEDPITDLIMEGQAEKGDTLHVTLSEGKEKLVLMVERPVPALPA